MEQSLNVREGGNERGGEQAVDWIIANQLGKRNLAEDEKSYLRGKRYRNEKKKVGGDGSNQHKSNGETDSSLRTSERLAKEYKVDPRTIHNDAKFSKAIDDIAEVAPEVKADILSGKDRGDVQACGKGEAEGGTEIGREESRQRKGK